MLLYKLCQQLTYLILKPILRFFLHLKIETEEGLEKLEPPLIIVFNHSSALDPFLTGFSLPFNTKLAPIRYCTWHEHYKRFLPFSWLFGCLPVRKVGFKKSLKEAVQVLENKGTVGIAPEGKRRHLGRKRRGRRGVAFLASRTKTAILPIYLDGLIGLTWKDFLLRKRKVKIRIGKTFSLEPRPVKKVSDLNDSAVLIMKKVYELQ